MTARSHIEGELIAFRSLHDAATQNRKSAMEKPLGKRWASGSGAAAGPADDFSSIVAASEKWSIDDEDQSEGTWTHGVAKLLGAAAFTVVGAILAVWFVGLVV